MRILFIVIKPHKKAKLQESSLKMNSSCFSFGENSHHLIEMTKLSSPVSHRGISESSVLQISSVVYSRKCGRSFAINWPQMSEFGSGIKKKGSSLEISKVDCRQQVRKRCDLKPNNITE